MDEKPTLKPIPNALRPHDTPPVAPQDVPVTGPQDVPPAVGTPAQASAPHHHPVYPTPTEGGSCELMAWRAAVITVSDRGAAGERVDKSGPAVIALLEDNGYEVMDYSVVPDGVESVAAVLRQMVAKDLALVITTGGTGFSPRDLTPEATLQVCERLCPGIPEAMRAVSLAVTPHGCLSREVAGIAGGTLIVNVPGSPKAATENLSAVIGAIGHGLKMLRGGQADCGAES